MTHEELCQRAKRWLSGTRRCNPVFSNIASCAEIPDAIGWASTFSWEGSTVLECKTSASDFYADKKKRFEWHKVGEQGFGYRFRSSRMSAKYASANGYEKAEVSMMGDFRFYFCLPGIITEAMVVEHAPDHGLLWKEGLRMRIVRPAPRRTLVDKDGEIRYLRFAIINGKEPYSPPESQQMELQVGP